LFARFNDQQVIVEEATGPRSSDLRFRHLFIPNRREEQNEIYEMHRNGLHFVGDWHTHPEPIPSASPSDLSSIRETFLKSKHHLNGFLMIIAGTDDFPAALHVSLHSATAGLKLIPRSMQ
jgi:integrative and conjugative element protein (TIGR02256 family)